MDILSNKEFVVRVVPETDGWHVRPVVGKETHHDRKAVAALRAKQLAVNTTGIARVVFYRFDGTVEVERRFAQMME